MSGSLRGMAAHGCVMAALAALLAHAARAVDCGAPGSPSTPSPLLCGAQAVLQRGVLLDLTLGGLLALGLAAASLLLALLPALVRRRPPVYLVDFSVFNPDPSWTFTRDDVRRCAAGGGLAEEDLALLCKLAYRSGLGDDTAVPPKPRAVYMSGELGGHKPGIELAREEYEQTCFPCVEELLAKTGVKPSQIGFVITNSSLFNPTPSLSAALINRFKLRDDTINYSLGGMGCSAGVVALDLARQMLQLHPGSYALVVSHENITNNYYLGKDKSMLLPNVLFRSNGSAVLLSSAPADAPKSKYTLTHVVRTIMAADDEAYRCIWQTDDEARNQGVSLKKELIGVAGRCLARNMGRLGPKVLPVSEQAKYAGNALLRAALKAAPAGTEALVPEGWRKPYTPDFGKAFDAVCIHTGGRGVIDSMEQNLGMGKAKVEASRAALYEFGNTSSCSVWYELAYAESFGGLRRGARVWQIAFGSGFKCNSAVLVANRTVKDMHAAWGSFDRAKMYAQLEQIDKEVAESRARRAAEKAAAPAAGAGAAGAAGAAAGAAVGAAPAAPPAPVAAS
ncbi:MAG: FAE1/Type III polyketide synthase-like protein-domain-containing protein [Monoraphidium minutum]|nr:MAG: FAE1/Type III polyketide synthase-like protein-domain-containing protein [Monoraphidium minutum]